MDKVVTYNLEYRDDDGKHTIPLTVDFIAQNRIEELTSFLQQVREIKFLWDKISDMSTEIGELKTTRPDGYKLQIEQLHKSITEAQTKIIDGWGGGSIMDARQSIISKILKQNGIEKSELYQKEWWAEHVQPSAAIDFLQTVVFKTSI